MKSISAFAPTSLALALAVASGAPAMAGTIEGWNTGNVVTTPGLDADGNGFSCIYDQPTADGIGNTSAYIKFTPPETVSPGLKVENDSAPGDGSTSYSGSDVANCILSAGPSSCNSEFQSGKRFKLDRTAFDPVDLVFNVDPNGIFDNTYGANDGLYKVFQKYGNNTDARSRASRWNSVSGSVTASSPRRLGMAWALWISVLTRRTTSSARCSPRACSARSILRNTRWRAISATSAPGSTWTWSARTCSPRLASSVSMTTCSATGCRTPQVPDGFFYDDDGDASTDAILMANQEADGTWSVNRGIDANGAFSRWPSRSSPACRLPRSRTR